MAHEHAHEGTTYFVEQVATIVLATGFGIAGLVMALDPEKKMLHLLTCAQAAHYGAIVRHCAVGASSDSGRHSVGDGAWTTTSAHAIQHAHSHEELLAVGTAAQAHEHGAEHVCCHHEHEHGESEGHVHAVEAGCCGHGEGHDHSHGACALRYVLLLLPIGFFMMNLPNKAMWLAKAADATGINVTGGAKGPSKGEMQLDFKELDQAAYSAPSASSTRVTWAGSWARSPIRRAIPRCSRSSAAA